MVDFPLHSLNMRPHTSRHIDVVGATVEVSNGSGAAPLEPAAEELYDLFGVAAHIGGISNGHYTAYVRSQV